VLTVIARPKTLLRPFTAYPSFAEYFNPIIIETHHLSFSFERHSKFTRYLIWRYSLRSGHILKMDWIFNDETCIMREIWFWWCLTWVWIFYLSFLVQGIPLLLDVGGEMTCTSNVRRKSNGLK